MSRIFELISAIVFIAASTASAAIASPLSTGCVQEPEGYEARCIATNIGTKPLTFGTTGLRLLDYGANNITASGNCVGILAAGFACFSEATFTADSCLRCQAEINGSTKNLKLILQTSPTPLGPINTIVTAP